MEENTPIEPPVIEAEENQSGTEIARPEDVLPANLHLLPMEKRPFFPGQVLPLIVNANVWGPTFKQIQESGQSAIGLAYVGGTNPEEVSGDDFSAIGTVCRIHQIEQHEEQLHVILAGLQRFRIEDWVSGQRPFLAQMRPPGHLPPRRRQLTTRLQSIRW